MHRHWLFALGFAAIFVATSAKSQSLSPDAAAGKTKMAVVTYRVDDLLARGAVYCNPTLEEPARHSIVVAGGIAREPEKRRIEPVEALFKLITSMVEPRSWESVGGKGRIQYFPLKGVFVVSQTPAAQEEIGVLLRALRELYRHQIAFEVRVVCVPDETWDKAGKLEWVTSKKNGSVVNNRLAFLNDAERTQLLETLSKDENTEVTTLPKLTLFNGQKSLLSVTDEQNLVTNLNRKTIGNEVHLVPQVERKELGFKANLQGYVSADRRFIRVEMDARRTQLEPSDIPAIPVQIPIPQPNAAGKADSKPAIFQMSYRLPTFSTQTVERKINVADGATAVIVAGRERSRTVLFLVTPRIVIDSEIEREILGVDRPELIRVAPKRVKNAYYYIGGLATPYQLDLPNDRELRVTQVVAMVARNRRLMFVGPNDPVPGQVMIMRGSMTKPQILVVNLNRAHIDPTEDIVVRDDDLLLFQETLGDTLSRVAGNLLLQIRARPNTMPMGDLSELAEPK